MFVSTLRSCFYLFVAAFLCVLVLPTSAQLPPPGYNSHWRTADGSEKLALEFGGGWDLATGAARESETRGWNYMMGAGYNFNRHLALLGEYGFNHFTVPLQPKLSDAIPLSGSTHIWSITADPKFQYFATDRVGAYVIGGGGFYRTSNNSDGDTGEANESGGVNFGTGIALKVSDNSDAKFYAEGRYTWIDNKPTPHTTYIPLTMGIRW
jgi:hypothetical protein